MKDLHTSFTKKYPDTITDKYLKTYTKDAKNDLELFEDADLKVKNILSNFLVDIGDTSNKEEFQHTKHVIEESIDKIKAKKQKTLTNSNKRKSISKTRIEIHSLSFLHNKKKRPKRFSMDKNDKVTNKDIHLDEKDFRYRRFKSFHKTKETHNEFITEQKSNCKFGNILDIDKALKLNKLSFRNDDNILSIPNDNNITQSMFTYKSQMTNNTRSHNIENMSTLPDDMIKSYNEICFQMKKSLFSQMDLSANEKNNLSYNEKEIQNIENNDIGNTITKVEDNKEIILSIPNKITKYSDPLDKNRVLKLTAHHIYDSLSDSEEEIITEINNILLIKPNSFIKITIDLLIIISTLFSIIIIPLELAFTYDYHNFPLILRILNIITEVIFICDLIFGFFTVYHDYTDNESFSKPSIIKNYFQSWFISDLLESIPFSSIIYIYLITHPNSIFAIHTKSYYHFTSLKYIHLLKIVKLIKVFKVSLRNQITSYLSDKAIHSSLGRSLLLYITITAFFFLIHLLSCCFIFIGYNNYPNWIESQNISATNHIEIYIASIYFLFLTILGVGYGDICPSNIEENLFTIFLLLIAVFIYSWLVSAISKWKDVDSEIYDDSQTIECQKKMRILKEINTGYKHMDFKMYSKIERYLKCSLLKEHYNPNIILHYLPSNLQKDLIVAMYKPLIDNFVFFKYFNNQEFTMKIILCLKPNFFLKNERIVDPGDFIEEMFFILKGKLTLEIPLVSDYPSISINSQTIDKIIMSFNKINKSLTYSKDSSLNKVNNIKQNFVKLLDLRTNEHYGDLMMFMNERSQISVRVSSKTAIVYYLKKTDAVNVSLQFPHIWKRIIINSIKNMKVINKLIEKIINLFYQHNQNVMKVLLERNELNLQKLEKTEQKMKRFVTKESKLIPNYDTKSIKECDNKNDTQKSFLFSESSTNRLLLSTSQNIQNVSNDINKNEEQFLFELENCKKSLIKKNKSNLLNNSHDNTQCLEEDWDDSNLSLNKGKYMSKEENVSHPNNILINNNNNDSIFDKVPQRKSLFIKENNSTSETIHTFSNYALHYNQPKLNYNETIPETSPHNDSSELSNNNTLYSNSSSINNELSTTEQLFPFHIRNHSPQFINNKFGPSRRLSQQQNLIPSLNNYKLFIIPAFDDLVSPIHNIKNKKTYSNNKSSLSKPNFKYIQSTPKSKGSFDLTKKFKYRSSSKLIRPSKAGVLEEVGKKVDSFGQISKELRLINFETGIQALDSTIKINAPQRCNTPKNVNLFKKKGIMKNGSSRKLEMIESNIEKSCLNLNDPKEFYSKKFKKMMIGNNVSGNDRNKPRKSIAGGSIYVTNSIINKLNS